MNKKEDRQRLEIENYVRELEKTDNVLEVMQRLLKADAERNAALHCASEVVYSPLYGQVDMARKGIKMVLRTWKRKIPKAKVEEVN
jgi:hypothetical protein